MIAFGFAGAFRRREIVSRNVADLEFVGNEMRVWIDRSKTDQFGRGAYIAICAGKDPRLCPILAVKRWMELLPGPGPLFRPLTRHGTIFHRRLHADSVTNAVKAFGVVLDLPEDRLGAHSLRAGMITALIDSGMGDAQIMAHSRHSSTEMLKKYYRPRKSSLNFTQMAGL